MQTKRLEATLLWFLAVWALGSEAAAFLGMPAEAAMLLAVVVALAVLIDPAGLLWTSRQANPLRAERNAEPAT
jgi:hypothetical protein